MRIMKARKSMSHAELHLAVPPALARRFDATTRVINAVIEDLIARDCLALDEEASAGGVKTYKYLA